MGWVAERVHCNLLGSVQHIHYLCLQSVCATAVWRMLMWHSKAPWAAPAAALTAHAAREASSPPLAAPAAAEASQPPLVALAALPQQNLEHEVLFASLCLPSCRIYLCAQINHTQSALFKLAGPKLAHNRARRHCQFRLWRLSMFDVHQKLCARLIKKCFSPFQLHAKSRHGCACPATS
jgi:hypothetical protein